RKAPARLTPRTAGRPVPSSRHEAYGLVRTRRVTACPRAPPRGTLLAPQRDDPSADREAREDAMPQSESKAWMIAWLLFTAMPLLGAAEAYRHHVVATAFAEASSPVTECSDFRPGRSPAVEQRDRPQRRPYAQPHARDGAVAILLLLAQG